MNELVEDRITICIPHWQVQKLMSPCLRSIRKHSNKYDVEVIVVDNGSKDQSLDYLKSLKWIKLIERPEETNANWPQNVFTAWDCGIKQATGQYFMTMHSDVFIKEDDWLDPYLEHINENDKVAAAGTWKLNLESPIYAFQKQFFGVIVTFLKRLFGKKNRYNLKKGHYPRDFCALYKTEEILGNGITFRPLGHGGGGYSPAKQLWEKGFQTKMIPVRIIYDRIFHIAHATAAVGIGKPLGHKRKQSQTENKVENLFRQQWIIDLKEDNTLDN